MKTIENAEFGGERPLFASRDLTIRNVIIHAGESALKECSNIVAENCRFEGKYPFWHVDGFTVRDCVFTPGARAALWYSKNLNMTDTLVEAPKMFREMSNIRLRNVTIPDAAETMWHCSNVNIEDVSLRGADYLLMHSDNIFIRKYRQQGNYSFQYCRDVEIRDAIIDSKDAFWMTENVSVYDSELNGEYLGWHSHNLHLVRCRISGTQPLCYARNLILEDCEFAPDCDLAFEESTIDASIRGHVTSIKNPTSGVIRLGSLGELLIDENVKAPADCKIEYV